MSAGGSYLNSNVSLISKASIRYEGTLYSINPQEATITLSNVRSYGTEDRKVEKFLAPKDTLFEYIIFKANDIKELIVDEPLNDPAIVTAQMPTSTSNNAGYSGFENSNINNGLSTEQQTTLNGITQTNANAPSVSSAGAGQASDRFRSRGSTPSSQARSPVSELSNKQKQESKPQRIQSNNNNHHQSNGGRHQYQNNQRRNNWNENRTSNYHQQNNNNRYDNNRGNRLPYQQNSYHQQNNVNRRNQYPNNYSNQRIQGNYRRPDNRFDNRDGFRSDGFRGNNQYHQNNRNFVKNGRQQPNKKYDATLKTEFDFEKANEAFQHLVEKFEDLEVVNGEKSVNEDDKDQTNTEQSTSNKTQLEDKQEDDVHGYDKTKSFFDNISCEAIERTKGNPQKFDWKQERKLNAETFGLKITYRRNDGTFRRPAFLNNRMNQNRRYNNGSQNQYQPRHQAPRTTSS